MSSKFDWINIVLRNSRNPKGSSAHLEDVLGTISNLLLEQKTAPGFPNTSQQMAANISTAPTVNGAKNKGSTIVSGGSADADSAFVVSRADFDALKRQYDELKMWKDRKNSDDEIFKRQVQESYGKLSDDVTMLSAQVKRLTDLLKDSGNFSVRNGSVTIGSASKSVYVRIAIPGSNEIHEFPTDDNGNLQVESVAAVFQG